MIRCARGVLEAIADHARRDAPRECCGMLIGTEGHIEHAEPAENCAPDPTRRYLIAPLDLLAAMKRWRGTSRGVIGAYHSHPHTKPAPSETDLAEALPDFLYLIAGPVAGDAALTIEAYRLENGNFRRIRIVPEAKEPET